jgi:hypothetical protein
MACQGEPGLIADGRPVPTSLDWTPPRVPMIGISRLGSGRIIPMRSGFRTTRTCRTIRFSRESLGLFLLSLVPSCGGEDSFDGAKVPYGPRTPTTRTTSTLSFVEGGLVQGPATARTSGIIGQKVIGGRTYDREANVNVSDPNQGDEYWIRQNADGTVDFAGFDMHSNLVAQVFPQGSVVFADPIKLTKEPPVGQPQAVALSGTLTPAGSTEQLPVEGTGQYTLAGRDAMVATDVGNLWGCNHYTGSLSTATTLVPQALQGVPVAGEMWIHPSFGVVAVSIPSLGIQTRMNSTVDCGAVDPSGRRTVRKLAIVDVAHGKLELSSGGCAGDLDADRSAPAQMLLELRFEDETLAKTNIEPTNNYRLGSSLGEFLAPLAKSDTSVLHPEENGKGYRYWHAFVSKAATSSPGGTSYGITVMPLANIPVRVSARLSYKVYPWPRPGVDAGVDEPDGSPGDDAADGGAGRDLPVAIDGASDAKDGAPAGDAGPQHDLAPIDGGADSREVGPGDGRPPREGGGGSTGTDARDSPSAPDARE